MPIPAEFDTDTVLSLVLLSGCDRTASGTAQILTAQVITQQSHELRPYSELGVSEHNLLCMLVGVHGSSTVGPGFT